MPAPVNRQSGSIPAARPSQSVPAQPRVAADQAQATGHPDASSFDEAAMDRLRSSVGTAMQAINGKGDKDKDKYYSVIANKQLKAMFDPELAKQELREGVKDASGKTVRLPPQPGSERYKLLTKVANGEEVTPDELRKGVSLVKDKHLTNQWFMKSLEGDFQKLLSEAKQKLDESMKKGK